MTSRKFRQFLTLPPSLPQTSSFSLLLRPKYCRPKVLDTPPKTVTSFMDDPLFNLYFVLSQLLHSDNT